MKETGFYRFKFFSLFFTLVLAAAFPSLSQNRKNKKVLVLEIKDEINPQMNRYVKLGLLESIRIKADIVAIEMNTYGGALHEADQIRNEILEHPKPVIVFINKNAASAGALISIACDSIYMAPGSNIGAATVVTNNGEKAGGKYQSYMRSIMRSTAEANGRNPALAEAMVDEDVPVDGLKQAGKVLSLTTEEALKYGYCENRALNLEEAIKLAGYNNYQRNNFELSVTDSIISFFLNPFISGILILLIIGGIYFEFQHPGLIVPILISTIAMVLYFIPYYLNGLAENWEIILFFIGVFLLALEILVFPGFGLAGVSGIILIVLSLMLVMLSNNFFDFSLITSSEIIKSLLITFGGLLGGIIAIIIGGFYFTKSNQFTRNVALSHVMSSGEGFTSSVFHQSLIGEVGVTFTILRPSGKIEIGGNIYDAYSQGSFIEKDMPVQVISQEGTSLKVRKIES